MTEPAAKDNPAASNTPPNPFISDHPADSLRLIGQTLGLVTTVLATFGDDRDHVPARHDLVGLSIITRALRAAIDYECGRYRNIVDELVRDYVYAAAMNWSNPRVRAFLDRNRHW